MMKDWTITCHKCGGNHARITGIDRLRGVAIIECPDCGKRGEIADE